MSADEPPFIRPDGCVCPMFRDTSGFRIADLTCPVHGIDGTDPGDGYWETPDAEPATEPPHSLVLCTDLDCDVAWAFDDADHYHPKPHGPEHP